MLPWHEKRSYDPGLPLQASSIRDLEFLAHWHSDIELLYVRSGSVIAAVNQDKRVLKKGELLVCASRDIHYYERTDQGSETILVILKPELVARAPEWPTKGALVANFATRSEHRELAARAEGLMRGMLEETKAKRQSYEGAATGMAMELCALAERELGLCDERGKARSEAPELERMQLAIDYVYEHSAYPIGLEDAARAASLSPSYFSRVFSKTVGTSFRSFLNGIRLERAAQLMSGTDARLADIALECGFESVRSFNRSFRALRGTTPSELRLEEARAKGRAHSPEGRGL
jgi:AraC-like DNA-binding protein